MFKGSSTIKSKAKSHPNVSRLNKTAVNLTLDNNSDQFQEVELTLSFNCYLEELLKKQIVENKIKEKEKHLKGQILFQEKSLEDKHEVINQIKKDIDLLAKKEEIIKMINDLETNIKCINEYYEDYQIHKQVKIIQDKLDVKSGVVIIKNVKQLEENELLTLLESVKKLQSSIAEECKKISETIKTIRESQIITATLNDENVLNLLKKFSDTFAKYH